MSQVWKTERDARFVEICLGLKLLRDADVDSLREATAKDVPGALSEIAVQRGLLTPEDVDIVQSLLNPTDVVPGYRVLDLIGRGGMGVVFRAEQIDLERIVALKTILISKVNDSTVAARFEREAKSLARLQHPNIVQALNFGKHEGRYYFAMEYVRGPTCEQALRDTGPMSPEEVWAIVRQVASGLMHALAQNLIHRDIKPANLILVPPPEGAASGIPIVKIADFGLAMFADQNPEHLKLTTGDKVMGSPAYMSLEQFGGRDVDFRSDIYSLGATAWHLLFGAPPFRSNNIAALYQEKSQPIVVDPSAVAIPDNQLQLLLGLLDPDPQRRPRDYRQLIEAIDALGVCEPVSLATVPAAPVETAPGRVSISQQPTLERDAPVFAAETTPRVADQNEPGMTSTIDTSQRQPAATTGRRVGFGIAAIVVLLLFGLAWSQFVSPNPGPRVYTRVVDTVPLFDGVTLSGWDVGGSMVGAWNTIEAPDASTAIACTTQRGALTRRLPPTEHPRIGLFVWLQKEGGPIDIDFAIDPANPSDVRGCLRMTASSNQLGEKDSDFGELDVAAESTALPTAFDRYHVVHLERQPTDWYVFLEEQLVGTLPIRSIGDGNAIRLVVHGEDSRESAQPPAFFADVQLYNLMPPSE